MTRQIDLGETFATSLTIEPNGRSDRLNFDGGYISTFALDDDDVAAIRDAMLNNRVGRLTYTLDESADE